MKFYSEIWVGRMRSFFSNYLAAAPYYWAGHHPVFIFILRYSCYTTVCIKIFHVQTREIRGFSDFNWHYQFHDIIRGFLWFQPALAVSRYFWPFSPRTFCCFENLTSINMNHSIVYSKKHGWNPYKASILLYRKILRVLGPLLLLVSVSPSVSLSVRLESCFFFFSFLGMWEAWL